MNDEMIFEGDPGKDGTPSWAYDEDGYCVACGNGRWKYHMPECALRDALDARAKRPSVQHRLGGGPQDDFACTKCPASYPGWDGGRSLSGWSLTCVQADCPVAAERQTDERTN